MESPAPKLMASIAVGKEWDVSKGRRKHSPTLKGNVALCLRRVKPRGCEGPGTVALLAAPYEVHPGQIEAGKKAFTEGAASVFGNGKEQKAKNDTALVARLHQEIGQLKVKREFLVREVRSRRLTMRWEMMDRGHPSLSIVRKCTMLGVSRSSMNYRTRGASEVDLALMQAMDRQYLETPFYGSRCMRI